MAANPNPSTSSNPSTSPNAGLNPSSNPNPNPNPKNPDPNSDLDEVRPRGVGDRLLGNESRGATPVGFGGPNPNPNLNSHGDGLVRHDGRHKKRHKPVADPRRETRPRHAPPLRVTAVSGQRLRGTSPHATRHGHRAPLITTKSP